MAKFIQFILNSLQISTVYKPFFTTRQMPKSPYINHKQCLLID